MASPVTSSQSAAVVVESRFQCSRIPSNSIPTPNVPFERRWQYTTRAAVHKSPTRVRIINRSFRSLGCRIKTRAPDEQTFSVVARSFSDRSCLEHSSTGTVSRILFSSLPDLICILRGRLKDWVASTRSREQSRTQMAGSLRGGGWHLLGKVSALLT